ncbi:MAG: cytochrome c biogenesis protein ResB [bacterium]
MNNPKQHNRNPISRFIAFWGSIKVSLVLFGIIIIVSIIGTLIPQKEMPMFYIQKYGETGYHLLKISSLIDVYSSWWFICLLFLLGLSTIVCTYSRYSALRRFLRAPQITVSESLFKDNKNAIKITLNIDPASASLQLLQSLGTAGYRAKNKTIENQTYIFAERGIYNRWGNLAAHISIVVILLGAIIGRFGFSEQIAIKEGETVAVPHASFSMHLNKFEVENYPNSEQPKEYRSFIQIFDSGNISSEKIIRVNSPLSYKGITFYQSSYSQSESVKSLSLVVIDKSTNQELEKVSVDLDKTVSIPSQDIKIKIAKFLPDFSMDLATKEPVSKSDQLNNPAVLLEEYQGDKLVGKTWLFANYPDFHGMGKTRFGYQLTGGEFQYYSVLQAVKDPGVPLVYLGFAGLLLGLFFTLFMEHKRIWVVISSTDQGIIINIAGASNRRSNMINKEIELISHEVATALKKR